MNKNMGTLGLAAIRSSKGITLQQIAEATKISTRALQAIEDGDFKKLPGGIYNTSYIRQYARAIEFDEYELLAYYHGQMGTTAEPPLKSGLSGGMLGYRRVSTIAGS